MNIKFDDVNVGQVFETNINGSFEIIEKISGRYNKVRIKFIETGWVTTTQFKNVNDGSIKDKMRPSRFGVGFIGDGKYRLRENNKVAECAVAWKSMLERCYCPKYREKFPTYEGCTVCDEWHNFQNFAEWWYENHPSDGVKYQLDKDKLVKGNKTYSPKTCTFLTLAENVRVSKAKEFVLVSPSGDVVRFTNMTKFAEENGLVRENLGKVVRGQRRHCGGWMRYEAFD